MPQSLFRFTALILILVTTGLGCRFQSREVREAVKPIELVWWRVFDDPDSVAKIIEEYRKIHPNITVTYRKLRFEEYEQELLDALAEDRGPDIFTVHNTAMMKYQPKLLPLPRELKIAYQVVKGTLKKETVVELRTEKTLRIDQLQNLFVDQVATDVVLEERSERGEVSEKIFGLPLASDTLVLYWNRDLMNAARIPEPAKTWDEFLQHVKLLTKFDAQGNIIQAGAAIGTAENIERATDILSTLMMQNGTQMIEGRGAAFDRMPRDLVRDVPPGIEALRFYTDFANPAKEAYTWNASMPNSLDAFTAGTTAYFFGYSYHLPVIQARAPKLNFGVAKLPQIDPAHEVNLANYWIEGISEKTKQPDEAWDFLQFATRAQNVASYLDAVKRPTALRSLVSTQLEDPDLSVFASEVLTAKNWYQGKDPAAAEQALEELIETAVAGTIPIEEAIRIAAGRVTQTLQ